MGQKFSNTVSKVDANGVKIDKFAAWKVSNPEGVYYDSIDEFRCKRLLDEEDVKYEMQPVVQLADFFISSELKTIRTKLKDSPDRRKKYKYHTKIRDVKDKGIVYTPDFYLPEFECYIEVKGFATDVFKLRWRLFKSRGHRGYIVQNEDELLMILEHLRERVTTDF